MWHYNGCDVQEPQVFRSLQNRDGKGKFFEGRLGLGLPGANGLIDVSRPLFHSL